MLGRTDQDLAFWRSVVAGGPPGAALELACGTGRVTLGLAQAGVEIVGLDLDPEMLAVARARRRQRRWPLLVAADMRGFAFGCRFAAVIVPYNSLQLLVDQSEAVACLAAARTHLTAGGIVGLEVTDFQRDAVRAEVTEQPIHRGRVSGQPIDLSGSLSHDLADRTSRYRRRFTGPGWAVEDEIRLRSYDHEELAAVLAEAGLTAVQWWVNGGVTRVVARSTHDGPARMAVPDA